MDIVLWSPTFASVDSARPNSAPVPAVSDPKAKGRWINPVRFLELIDAWHLAKWACMMAVVWRNRLHPALPSGRHPGGAPSVYRDETILLTMLVLRAWRLSLEKLADWLGRYDGLAVALGMDPARTISSAQLCRWHSSSSCIQCQ